MRTLAALALLASLTTPARAQGYSYDVTMTGDMPDPRTGVAAHRIISAAHGQFANGNARIDFTQSMMPGGMMSNGTYILARTTSPITTFVDPARKEYFEINRDELGKEAADMGQKMGGMVKMEVTGIQVDVQNLGAGEAIEGNATVKYRITTDYTMNMSVMGKTTSTPQHAVTDLWVAPALDGVMNPMARQSSPTGSGGMAALTAAIMKGYAKVGKGVVLKSVRTSEVTRKGVKQTTTMVTEVTNLKKTSVNPAVFVVPAGYTKTTGMMAGMGGMADSMAAARGRVPPPN